MEGMYWLLDLMNCSTNLIPFWRIHWRKFAQERFSRPPSLQWRGHYRRSSSAAFSAWISFLVTAPRTHVRHTVTRLTCDKLMSAVTRPVVSIHLLPSVPVFHGQRSIAWSAYILLSGSICCFILKALFPFVSIPTHLHLTSQIFWSNVFLT